MPIQMYPKGSEEQLNKWFQAKEFDCKCTRPECDYTLIDDDLLELLGKLRDNMGHPIQITSAFRCKAHQADLVAGGNVKTVPNSTHTEGRAADIRVRHFTPPMVEVVAREVGFMAVGVAHSFCHLDTRKGKVRAWKY